MFVFKVKNFLSIIFIIILSVSFIGTGIYSYSEKSFIEFSGDFWWPLNGYTYISSRFGYRTSPTSGASTYHSGIDIPAPEGTPIYSVTSGTVTFCSWGAGGGYTVVIENETYKISYCHVSPVMIVKLKQDVKAGEKLGKGDIITLTIPNLYVVYPDFIKEGYSVVDIKKFCTENGVTLEVKYQSDSSHTNGEIIYQNMVAGTKVSSGGTLSITVVKNEEKKDTKKEEASEEES